MPRFKDLSGQVFGSLVVLKPLGTNKNGYLTYLCQCECGNRPEVFSYSLRRGVTSCGCRKVNPKMINLMGKVFGYLTVLSKAKNDSRGEPQWLVVCNCGNTKIVISSSLRSGRTRSCGCSTGKFLSEKLKRHGMTGTGTWKSWQLMRNRCFNKKSTQYKWYGGRGITVCDRWLKFENFFADMGEKPPGMTLDRKDTNGNYEPDNCRWATWLEQQNNRRNNRMIEFKGQTKTLAQWCRAYDMPYLTVLQRLNKLGWSVEEAFTIRPDYSNDRTRNRIKRR